jgi:integrase
MALKQERRELAMASWIDGWKKTRYPGIWAQGSSVRIRVRTTCPKTGKRVEANRVFEGLSLREAPAKQHELLTELLQESEEAQRTRFGSYATSLYKRKVAVGEIKSRKSMERWEDTLEHHLFPAFGDHFLDAITLRDLETFKAAAAAKVRTGEYSPHTVNGWLSILRTVGTTATLEYQLERNPFALLKDIDTSEHRTYTEEQPNSLTDAELAKWLEWFATNEPQHYAFVFLGFMTGQRPSHLRPLRRRGAETDVLWDQGTLLIRRSETLGHVMNRTKTAKDQRIGLPPEVMDVLRDHVRMLEFRDNAASRSDLLFPSDVGAYRAASCLDKPFAECCKALGLTKKITPRAMRRTSQDMLRVAEVHDTVTRSISGHASEIMTRHYSTAYLSEQREAIGKVVALSEYKRRVA